MMKPDNPGLQLIKESTMRALKLIAMLGVFSLIIPFSTAQAQKKAKKDGTLNHPYNNQEPAGMQRVFRSVSQNRGRPQYFDYAICGRYEQARHKATICILEDGRIFGGIPRNIDENDKITVYLIVRRWVSQFYRVQMKPQSLASRGPAGGLISKDLVKRPKKEQFIVRRYVFGPFRNGNVLLTVNRPSIGQPGLGQVDITYLMKINPLSTFSIAVGFIGVTPIIPKFKLLQERGSSITRIALAEEGAVALDLILVAKIFSWQFWDRSMFSGRDTLKPPLFLQRININIGLSFQDLLTSYYLGIGFEVSQGFDLMVGANFRVVDELAGGFKVGDPFAGDITEIPTVRRFRVSLYFGISITPEVFTSLFRTLTSGSLFGTGG